MDILTLADRAALAAYCQAYGRWVGAETKLAGSPVLLKAPSGYVQQSPWLAVANKQLELMGRYMSELGLTPAARARLSIDADAGRPDPVTTIKFISVYTDENGNRVEQPVNSRQGDGETSQCKPPDERFPVWLWRTLGGPGAKVQAV